MLQQIGLNHLFDDGTICFCLVCKDSITQNYPLDRDSAIREHFKSEGHEKNARNLFKTCVQDPKCESRNVRYLDIVNNSEFEVWEQGNEPSYVSRQENHFVCLICKEEVSKVCGDTDNIKYNFQYHLESELHVTNVKNSIWWTYHPTLDTNYIALNKIFMYCSFCQKFLKSKENLLLEFAADHIEIELSKTNIRNPSKMKPKAINTENISKTELQTTILNYGSKTELETYSKDTNSDGVSNIQFDPGFKPITSKSCPKMKNTQDSTTQSNEISDHLKSSLNNDVNSSEISFNQDLDKLKSASESLCCQSLDSNSDKEDVVVCTECHEQVEIFNGDVSFSMLKHSQKHKDLSSTDDAVALEIQGKADLKCRVCLKQIEIFNKDPVLSYSHHFQECHPDTEIIENVNNDCNRNHESFNEPDIIAKAVSLLPNGLSEHLNFVTLVEEHLYCTLCNCELISSNDITIACDFLQNHFSEFYHKSQYEVCVQQDTVHSDNDEELEETMQSFKGLQFHRSTVNKIDSPSVLIKNVTLGDSNTEKRTLEVPGEKVRSRFQVQAILFQLVNVQTLVNNNKHHLDEKAGNFYCILCDEILRCTRSGSELIKHLNGESHFTKSKSRMNKQNKGKIRTRAQVLNILEELSIYNKVIKKHIEDLGEKNGHFFCKPCNEEIMCSLRGAKLVDHLNGLNHGLQMKNVKGELRAKARSSQQVYNILWQLSTYKSVVSENIDILGEKQGHFYCEICDEILVCTWSGKYLIEHLQGQKHVFNLLTSNNMQ